MQIHSVHFAYSGSKAIKMKDPITDQFIGDAPEWVRGIRNNPVAYVRYSSITVEVIFSGNKSENGWYDMDATGRPGGFQRQSVHLQFSNVGFSNTVSFKSNFSLFNQIGTVDAAFDWRYLDTSQKRDQWQSIGKSTHTIYTTWKPMVQNSILKLYDWAYVQLIQWTSTWAAGRDGEKTICDAIISNLYLSGLKYYISAWTIRDMLLQGGGMCGGWASMFQYMAHCQGVFVYRRCYLVDWRDRGSGAVQWNAIVVTVGGLNRPSPPVPSMTYNDDNTVFPISAPTTISTVSASRYRFWGRPGGYEDGHCINFLVVGSLLYLYDPSFGSGPFALNMSLPPDNYTILGGKTLSSFKTSYLNQAVLYMLGSLYNGTVFYQTTPPSGSNPGTNGMTVKTSLIPDVVGSFDEITFYWGP